MRKHVLHNLSIILFVYFAIFMIFAILYSSQGHAQTYIRPPALIEGITTTATAAGTTTLTASSQTNQEFTGSSTQTVVLPNATTLDVGRRFIIMNRSTGNLTVNFNGGSLAKTITPSNQYAFIVVSNGTAAGTWDVGAISITNTDVSASAAISYSKLATLNTGQVLLGNAGTPTATTLSGGATVGATGTVTLGNTAVTGQALTGYVSGAGTVAATDSILQAIQKLNGNDGNLQPVATLTTKGDMYVATGASTVVRQGVGSNNQTLIADSAQTNGIKWGTLPIAGGGTGQTSQSAAFNALSPVTTLGDIIYGSGSNANSALAGNTTTTKKFLTQTGNGSVSAAPAWGTIAQTDLPATSVSAQSSSQMEVVWVIATANCTASPCTLAGRVGVNSNGVTRSATGNYTMSYITTYTSAGACFVFCSDGSNNMQQPAYTTPTTTAFNWQCRTTSGTNVDAGFMAVCFPLK